MEPAEDDPKRALLTALGAMAAVAVLVGLAIGAVALGAIKFVGLDGGGDDTVAAPESLYLPDYEPTKSNTDELPGLPSTSTSPTPSISLEVEPTPKGDKITLFAAPQSVAPGERINFNGVYVDGEGVALQIQRREEGTWTDFPVSATVRGGVFDTWILTSRPGDTEFRVVDKQTDRASNVVKVQIG